MERSANGLVWETIGMINGAGTTSTTNDYFSYDEHPWLGLTYYRIMQTDFDGNSSFSNTDQVTLEDEIVIYPVPANDHISIQLGDAETAQIRILNELGEELNCNAALHSHTVDLDLSNLPAGIYYAEIGIYGNTIDKKFVKL